VQVTWPSREACNGQVSLKVHFSKETIGAIRSVRPDGECVHAQRATVTEAHGRLVRLHPLTILLLSSDRNFRVVISLLLSRRGCTVIAGRLIEPGVRELVDVVLIDGGQSRTTITRSVQIAQALPPSVGVVVVAGTKCSDAHGLPLVDRWGPFPELYAAIQKADRRRQVGGG
jgi:hypothetical protein